MSGIMEFQVSSRGVMRAGSCGLATQPTAATSTRSKRSSTPSTRRAMHWRPAAKPKCGSGIGPKLPAFSEEGAG